jgi:hypothetical protein
VSGHSTQPRRKTSLLRPPQGSSFVWITVEIFEAQTFGALSIAARRILDYLCAQQCHEAGRANGDLAAPYSLLETFGVTKSDIRKGLAELEATGFVRRVKQGLRVAGGGEPSRFALTWLPTRAYSPRAEAATNDWKAVLVELRLPGRAVWWLMRFGSSSGVMPMTNSCAIWRTSAERGDATPPGAGRPRFYFNSPRAGGAYVVEMGLDEDLGALDDKAKARLTTWIANQHRAGVKFPEITSDVVKLAASSRPMGYSQRVRQLFMYLDRRGFGIGEELGIFTDATRRSNTDEILIECELSSDREALVLRVLREDGLFIKPPATAIDNIFQLSPAGYARLDEVARSNPTTVNAFVAMWFDKSMTDAFEHGIEPAIIDAGYKPIRIDRKDHINKIDDEIIAEIRRARFVVADFTCGKVRAAGQDYGVARGGVYYEAGYAQALGVPVIWTVRADQINDVHFDTRQYAHITWNEPDGLDAALYQRIAATIGLAPGTTGRTPRPA